MADDQNEGVIRAEESQDRLMDMSGARNAHASNKRRHSHPEQDKSAKFLEIPVFDQEKLTPSHNQVKKKLDDFAGEWFGLSASRGITNPAWGVLNLKGNTHQAPFVCVPRGPADDKKPARPMNTVSFVREVVKNHAGASYEDPSLILSITGGADSLHLPPRMERALTQGIQQAALRTKAWVVSGGTNVGVMRLTGSIMQSTPRRQGDFKPPTIGIATYGVIRDHDLLHPDDRSVRSSKRKEKQQQAQPNSAPTTHAPPTANADSTRSATAAPNEFAETEFAETEFGDSAYGFNDEEGGKPTAASSVAQADANEKKQQPHGGQAPPGRPKYNTLFDKDDVQPVPLDPNHDFFILVDDGTDNKFGGEIEFRAEFEKAAKGRFDCPVVTVVIQGGPGTLNTALESVRAQTPIVVVEESGQTADVLAYAYNFMHSQLYRHTSYTLNALREMIKKAFKIGETKKVNTFLEKVLECVQHPGLVVVYNPNTSGLDAFDKAILQAVFKTENASLLNKLKQAMFFDNIDIARNALHTATEAEVEECINDNLLYALQHNKPDFVELYLSHGAHFCDMQLPSEHRNLENAPESYKDAKRPSTTSSSGKRQPSQGTQQNQQQQREEKTGESEEQSEQQALVWPHDFQFVVKTLYERYNFF
ncbi:hypothetical protein PTSG_01969 [Salpingoeca rosetta]|uniref:TRPM SLOG domain-containing protein n=1 Tax=Salpingoeca rosetta (strain ATCC 50818 / BSB-021) TaxID=946362 RepID=F2TZH4_SALR5|nr:uncharacterized protein PTSG_01969 [Salpingoeca rosetta]EGD78998.1 hypothetical protein PTSG_01969 [Salpingoeca rosetta]|eukprot:XP_004997954.1 hypothetical protein PTSG_01969 [Salpingoeca rosetta]